MQQTSKTAIFLFKDKQRRNPEGKFKIGDLLEKACQDIDISTKITRENADIFADILFAGFNDSVEKSNFPSSLKHANKTPVFKKGDRDSKDNYRPVNVLPNMSKIFERCIFRQLYSFMLELLSKYKCGFRKGYPKQHCMLVMLEN